jgi:predicted nucleic acid-binding protein
LIFLDTSALVTRYMSDGGPDLFARRDLSGERVFLSDLARVEFRSAVARRRRAGRLSDRHARRVLEEFEAGDRGYDWVPVDGDVLRRAQVLVDRHALRSLDALQLAGALVAAAGSPEPLRFGCLDARLAAAARAEGLEVLRA